MRILFLSHYFPPEGNAPASRTYDHCKRWVAAGHEVTVVTSAPNVPAGKVYAGYRNRLTQTERVDGIRVVRVWTFIAPNKGSIRRTLNYFSYMVTASLRGFFLRGYDIIIATSPQFFCGFAGVLLSRARKKPFVLEIRDIWPESIQAVGAVGSGFALRMLARMEREMYRAADRIVTVGDGYRDKLLERSVSRSKISVIPNGADCDFFAPGDASAELRSRLGLNGKFVIAYVGTIGMACGLDCVLEVAEKLKEKEGELPVQFLLVGDGARRQELEEEARSRGLSSVTFAGLLPKHEIPDLLRSVDACLVHLMDTPTFQTVLPSKMFEAFSVAKPVILGVGGQAASVLQSAKAGILMQPENPDSLLKAVDALRDDAFRERLGNNGRKFALEKFNREVLAERYLKQLAKLAPGRAVAKRGRAVVRKKA